MKNVISLENASVAYRNTEAVSNVTLQIAEGEFVCVIGPNGGGKTTLLNAILGFLKPSEGKIILSEDKSKTTYVPQIATLERDFPMSVTEAVMTAFLKNGLHPFRLFKKSERQKACELLALVGLENKVESPVSQLSGGEFQRMLIARALATEPSIILLDEPTANIDPASSERIYELLAQLNAKGITVVTVTHDLVWAARSAQKLICINRELVFCGKPESQEQIIRIMYGKGIVND